MTYSYTQISQYLTCPRRYRHRYLDGWQEKDTRAAMLFGRAFERALAAYFLREDAAAALFREWAACQNQGLQYTKGDTWDHMLQQGIQLLDRFCQDDRIRIRQPRRNQQIKFTRPVSGKKQRRTWGLTMSLATPSWRRGTGFEQVGSEAMAEHERRLRLGGAMNVHDVHDVHPSILFPSLII
jgi:hypothetical protein